MEHRVVEQRGAICGLSAPVEGGYGEHEFRRNVHLRARPVTHRTCRGLRGVKTKTKSKTVARGLRIDSLMIERIERAARDGGFSSSTAFIRAAIERELAGRDNGMDTAEERIAASLNALAARCEASSWHSRLCSRSLIRWSRHLLTCVPEPPRDAYDQAVARGKFRYERFLKSVGAGMAGDSHAAMAELVKREGKN